MVFLAALTSFVIADDVLVIDVDFGQAYTAIDVNETITDKDKNIFPFNLYFAYFGENIDKKNGATKILITPNHGDDILTVILNQSPDCEHKLRLVDLKNMT